jgi:hypothetical protein
MRAAAGWQLRVRVASYRLARLSNTQSARINCGRSSSVYTGTLRGGLSTITSTDTEPC